MINSTKCALPQYALLALFVTNAITTLYFVYKMFQVRSLAKDRVRRILNLANCAIIGFAIELLALYLENGWFTATSVMVCFVILIFGLWGVELIEVSASAGLKHVTALRLTLI